ncbi:MAG: TetM/TetW/TetO/TetS family tetracycline resistance ribosomal protection protein [Ruminococcus sp.]|nr:TetM/TetW/TetO/TetS family tetracycline resistance ribosomal protection protein [Ruminococcus sp.]
MRKIAVGILAHVDSGKTTLSEALMYCSGNLKKLGRVDHKNSFLDNFALERDRGITIFSKQAVLNYKDTQFTLLDTPGHVDFSAETERTLQVLDYAILVISGTDGVQSHTATLWKLLRRYRVPCFVFVNKMDLDGADKERMMSDLKSKLSERCVDFTNDNSCDFFENVALCDEKLLEKYENDALTKDDIISAVGSRKVIPCMFGSALRLNGVKEFLELMDSYIRTPEYDDNFAAKVYKISQDSQGSRLTFLKITGGSLKVREVLKSDKNKDNEKINQIRIYSGEKFTAVTEAEAGTVCAVTGVSFTNSGDGLGAQENSGLPVLEPVLTYRVDLHGNTDVHTAMSKLKILEAEDPMLGVEYNERLGEIQVQLMGDIQLEVLSNIIEDRFGFSVSFDKGSIIYKETIRSAVEGVGHFEPLRHYAEVHLLLTPLKRDSGLVFSTDCKEDKLDKNWQRLILTHLYEKTHIGVLTGSPITDMEITLVAGRAHPKHTEGGDFRQATYRAVRQGLRSAESILLEPVFEFTLEVPNENLGRAMSDIQMKNGSFNSPEGNEEFSTLTGTAPAANMLDYSRDVSQYTHGKGKLTCRLKGYEPCHNADEVIAHFGYNPDSDVDNPCDSVFCSHGAGHNVKWDEVPDRMHLPYSLRFKAENPPEIIHKSISSFKNSDNLFAMDKELMKIFEQTYGPVRKPKEQNVRKKFTAKDSRAVSKYKGKPAPNYDGDDYLLVDGYNVIFSWDELRKLSEDNIDGARQKLINILCNYQGYKKCELIIVFDAYKVKGEREVERVNNIDIVYTKEAETADMYIEKTSHKLAKNNRVRVVTSDGTEQLIILGGGALRVSSQAFFDEVKEAEDEIRRIINET